MGRAVLLDAHQGTRIVSHLDPDTVTAFDRASLTVVANPDAARHIPAQVRRAGLGLDPDVARPPSSFVQGVAAHSFVQRAAEGAIEIGRAGSRCRRGGR
jgi:hypothetical protein